MNNEYTQRLANYQTRLAELLAMESLKYSDWPPVDTTRISASAGVYHFFKKQDDQIIFIYIGKGGFGRGEKWSLYARLKQHIQTSQNYVLLGKSSKALGLSPDQMKIRFKEGNYYLQWLTFATKSDSPFPTHLESDLRLFKCFAIAVLNPQYTDA